MDLAGYYFVRESSRELVYGRSGVPGFSEYGPTAGIAGIVLCSRGFLVILHGVGKSLTSWVIIFCVVYGQGLVARSPRL